MGKQIGLLVAFGFALYALYQFVRRTKSQVTGSLPTGISRGSYFQVGIFLFLGPLSLLRGASRLSEQFQSTPKDPTLIAIGSGYFLIGVFLLLFAAGAILQILKIQRAQKLTRGGGAITKAEGRFIEAKKSFFLSFRNAPAWILSVEYQDMAGSRYLIKSEPVWFFDPVKWARPEIPVPLLINRLNPSEAWVLAEDYYKACKKP